MNSVMGLVLRRSLSWCRHVEDYLHTELDMLVFFNRLPIFFYSETGIKS